MSSEAVQSPCVKLCKLEEGICIGCGRNLDDIRDYGRATNAQRRAINEAAARRLAELAKEVGQPA